MIRATHTQRLAHQPRAIKAGDAHSILGNDALATTWQWKHEAKAAMELFKFEWRGATGGGGGRGGEKRWEGGTRNAKAVPDPP